MMRALMNAQMLAAQQADAQRAGLRCAVVSAFDADAYAVRVRLQPEDVETGWLPIATLAAGAGWGLQLAPKLGAVAIVQFERDAIDAGIVTGFQFGDRLRPQAVPAGEFALRHESGSRLHFRADGSVDLIATGTLRTQAPAWQHQGNATVQGNVTVQGTVTASTDVVGAGVSLKSHRHAGVRGGTDTSGPPA